MSKYELLPAQLLHEGTLDKANLFTPEAASEEQILAVRARQVSTELPR